MANLRTRNILTNHAGEKHYVNETQHELDRDIDRSDGVFSSSTTKNILFCTVEPVSEPYKRWRCYETSLVYLPFPSLMLALSPSSSKSAFFRDVEKFYGTCQTALIATTILYLQ